LSLLAFFPVSKSAERSLFGSGEKMAISQIFQYWAVGIGGGAACYIVFSLIGAGIYKALSVLNS
jgi:hypothetical protein